MLVFLLAVGPWLFTRYPRHNLTAEQTLKAKNDVRTTLVQAFVGLAVASGAIVTYRTFSQNRREHDRSYELRQAEQINEFFATAVDQLGHQHAPVRLGALYSLVQLAQANPPQRASVVDVICGYLRMPYTPAPPPVAAAKPPPLAELPPAPAAKPPPLAGLPLRPAAAPADDGDAQQELQVRLTAQRLLAAHLRPPDSHHGAALDASPSNHFWPGVILDLVGATLVDFDLREASLSTARFDGASFTGDTSFVQTTFTSDAHFVGAAFGGRARFVDTEFLGGASFDRARFAASTRFDGAHFHGDAHFEGATFTGDARFTRARFAQGTLFRGATFAGDAMFGHAAFTGSAVFAKCTFSDLTRFADATFDGVAEFAEATFAGIARFGGTQFNRTVQFREATFVSGAQFDEATFADDTGLRLARVLHLDDPDLNKPGGGARRIWPENWKVRAGWDDPTQGTLVRTTRPTPRAQS
ncbi:pentapeptide repeat-containing protein [Actinoplanes sp. NPDC049596]|uniref:pentapeptide repeat-containing protein n=1 Tax=unclassified Actinoplanes TaxID=2626549 RepID=UPI003434A324